ncbi:MAG: hypothetical protein HUU25_06865 [Candidatus Sumerlaeia bacterium]|nr:hypothetical protein [Candidatus Sumerlaeia bacterium]
MRRHFLLAIFAASALACSGSPEEPAAASSPSAESPAPATRSDLSPASAEDALAGEASGEGVAIIAVGLDNETNIAAYHVHRGDSPDGPWRLVETVQGQGAGSHGRQHYRVIQEGLPLGRVYYYLIETVRIDGQVHRSPPIRYVVQRLISDEATAAPSSP